MKGKTSVGIAGVVALMPLVQAFQYCPPTGQVLPAPQIPDAIANKTNLGQTLAQLVESPGHLFNKSTTSFSVTVTSSSKTLFEFHHTADLLSAKGAQHVDGDTVYRIASVSKLFTTLSAMLQDGLNLDDLAWKHVPELEGVEAYKDITLRMLASHVSGIVRDGYAFDLAASVPPQVLQSLGFPNATTPDWYPLCDSVGHEYCSREEFFSGLRNSSSVWAPGVTPAYSNFAFILLGLAAESYSGKKLGEIISEKITGPLGMTSSGHETPEESRIIAPEGSEEWATIDLGYWKGTAGVFSTPSDLARFARGIINHEILSPVKTNLWLKPTSFTTSTAGGGVGMPWSIVRTSDIQRPSGERPLEVYSMIGSFAIYGAYIAVIPEYNIGFTVNIAGPGGDILLRTLLGLAIEKFVPVVDGLAREQATHKYAGLYKGPNSSLLRLGVDGGPGLKIEKWENAGKSVFDAWMALSEESEGASGVDARLYPVTGNRTNWQIGFLGLGKNETTLFKDYCETWFAYDKLRFAGLSVDEVVFEENEQGQIKGLKVPGLRADLAKC
ncbi:unnamed protein product [Clonostachys rosea]|uniref:Beta-lactamase-related domain-containing protein n=1 Tax=Bionectria ochroleuca TaxID=29856 RepID=A0ABY6U6V7_BIOOC|nr:unnamed protein product [Clonostachys rosea]